MARPQSSQSFTHRQQPSRKPGGSSPPSRFPAGLTACCLPRQCLPHGARPQAERRTKTADYFPGQIEIGGEVPSRLVKGLCKQIRLQGVSLDYGGEHFEPTGAQDLLYAAQGGTLKTCDPEARFGQFEELEAWLARHGIAFSRHSDVKHEFDAENVDSGPA